MSILKRILAVMLVAVMALSLAGCGDTSWIMKANDITLNSGLYIYYQTQGYIEAVFELAAEDINYYYYYMYGQSLADQKIGDQTVMEYVDQYAIDMCKQYVVTEQLFRDLGLELSEEDEAIIKAKAKQAWDESSASFENIGVSESTVRKAVESQYKEGLVFDAYYEVGGIKGTTEETIKAYFEEDYARIKYMTFNFVESADDKIDEAKKNEQKELADSYLSRAQAGEDFNALIDEYNEYLEGTATEGIKDEVLEAEEETDETEETEEVDEYLNEYIVSVDTTYPSEKFVNYVFNNCKVGEFTLIQDDTNFYLVQKLDVLEREDVYESSRDTLISEIYDSDYTALINETLKGYEIVINEKSVSRYDARTAIEGREEK